MIKVTVLYPHTDGARFDMDYYVDEHLPMVTKLLGDACKGASADFGLGGGAPSQPPIYAAMGHLLFDSEGAFHESFQPHTAQIMGDVPNYTDISPIIQVSEVRMS